MFPINLDLRGQLTLLVGAGRVGRRKLTKLLDAGAWVRVVEPRPRPEIAALAEAGRFELAAEVSPEILRGVRLAFIATGDAAFNAELAGRLRAAGVWVNVADSPEASDFTLPAVVERGGFRLAVSTGSAGPALAARVAARLRGQFGPEYGRLTALLAALRPRVLASALGPAEREALFQRLAESEALLDHLAQGDAVAARELVDVLTAPLALGDIFDH
jgi:precorrin-2 dehydrogenase/sirohydrochlorin ferrochelatase